MVNRKPNGLEKAFMIRQRHLAEKQGRPHEYIKWVRRILASVFSCREGRVRATMAWYKIRPDLIKREGIAGADAAFVRKYIGLAGSQRERETLEGEAAEILRMPLGVIERISRGVRVQTATLLDETYPNSGDPRRQNLERILRHDFDPVELLRGGEHVDYGTPMKDKARGVAGAYLDRHFSAEAYRRSAVLCLPGKRCLEVPMYLDRGVPPQNIVGVEGGDRLACAEFAVTARECGITGKIARLEEFLPTDKTRFNVAFLDFDTPVSQDILKKIASQLLLAERAVVIVNTMAKREQLDVQEELQWLWDHMRRSVDDEAALERAHRQFVGEPEPTQMEGSGEWSLGDSREMAPALWMAGMERKENWGFGGKAARFPLVPSVEGAGYTSERRLVQENLYTVFPAIQQEVITLLRDHGLVNRADLDEVKALSHLDVMFDDVVFGNKYITDLEKYSYQSETSAKAGSFHTDMALILTPRQLYQRLEPAVEFLLTIVGRALEVYATGEDPATLRRFKFAIMRGRNEFVAPGEALKTDAVACLLDGTIICQKQVHVLLNALREHHAFRSRESTYASLLKKTVKPRMPIE
ncbi:MAG: Uncharacterized protein Greene041619_977 [Candidatus Peregrinibacteria bacterium Greene0416_19]|nr:MAG: Uncharacterized protein Greene041619_977 [Candidatus Peregrinibacteria bacterium Greene0416_19]